VSKANKTGRATTNDELDFGSADDLAFGGDDLFPTDDPIGPIDYPGTADGDTAATLGAVGKAFKERAAQERKRFQNATDSEYWFAVVFETRAQKEAFLKAMKWIKGGDKYLDGIKLAELEGVDLPAAEVPYVPAKPDRKLDELSLPLE
jgi:hypothetical protein